MAIELDQAQLQAIDNLKTGSILCGGVGSGKSRTALAYYFLKVCGGSLEINGAGTYAPMKLPRALYIITTARKRDTHEWEDEMAPFLLEATVDSWNNIKKYEKVQNAYFIFDEQRVVGYGSWVKSFLKITAKNPWILLSATPGDTWTDFIPVFIANGFYKNKTEFMRRHAVFSRYSKYPKVERWVETKRLERLRDSILVNIAYYKKTVIHDEVIMASYDRHTYRDIYQIRWNPYKQEPIVNAGELCYVLRKIVNSDPSRIDIVQTIALSNPRVIVFYNYDYELEQLRSCVFLNDTQTAEWNGHKHEPIPESERWVYFVQYAAGAEGWNCTKTNTIIFFSESYSYKQMVQAAGRIDRRNTPYTDLFMWHIRSSAPIDIAIQRCLAQKKNFNESHFVSARKCA